MKDLLLRAREVYKENGLFYVLIAGAKIVYGEIEFVYLVVPEAYHRLTKHGRLFRFNAETYAYLYRRYNRTWNNERSVEIPIAWRIVGRCSGRILEVGNVLSHYFPCRHDVLDKYERGKRVINCDVVDYRPSSRYDLIVSISTLEHVGFDEPRDPNPRKIAQGLENLRSNCLAPAGEIVITLPLGYNVELDRLLREGELAFTKLSYLKRVSKDNKWMETEASDVANARYNFPFPAANALVVGVIKDETKASQIHIAC